MLQVLKSRLRKFRLVQWCLGLSIVNAIKEGRQLAPFIVKKPDKLMINIGAGAFNCKNWINLDYVSDWYADIHTNVNFMRYDIRNDLIPLGNETVFCAYCSHVIEHIETPYIEKMFQDVYRILGGGGYLRLAFPDADFLYNVTLQNSDYWYWRLGWFKSSLSVDHKKLPGPLDFLVREIATPKSIFYRWAVNPIDSETLAANFRERSPEEFLNFLVDGLKFRADCPGDHINWWSYEKCKATLLKAGFKNVILSKYKGSVTPYMCGNAFDRTYPRMSCYVEAIK
ncbi:MAG: hypothetical protein LBQ08_01095 [Holosporaceae bacterium]|jgi:SAM-dependent methyltransferase|nr:hypothetical protein [Holosporaceae bacterium]